MKHAMKEQRLHAKAGNALAHGKVFKAVKLEVTSSLMVLTSFLSFVILSIWRVRSLLTKIVAENNKQ